MRSKPGLALQKEGLFHCPMDLTMFYIGGKWKTVVLWYLVEKKRRFSELTKLIPGITEKSLSLQLKQLERDGFICKIAFAESPPRVVYELTEEGKTLIPVIRAMSAWGVAKGNKVTIRFEQSNKFRCFLTFFRRRKEIVHFAQSYIPLSVGYAVSVPLSLCFSI